MHASASAAPIRRNRRGGKIGIANGKDLRYLFHAMIENYKTASINVTFGDEPPAFAISEHELRWNDISERYLEYRFQLWLDECGKEIIINAKS